MRKLILTIVAAMALVLPAQLEAQAGNITATATVNAVFWDGASQNLTFDAVNPGTAASVDVTTGNGGTPGYMEFGFNADYKVTATTLPTTLSETGGSGSTLSVAWECGVSSATTSNPASAAACAQGDVVTSDAAVSGVGSTVVWLGGTIADTNVLAGTYTGSITFTISAN